MQTPVLYPKVLHVSREFLSVADFFAALVSYFSAPAHRIVLCAVKKEVESMDVDDLIYGNDDPGPSER